MGGLSVDQEGSVDEEGAPDGEGRVDADGRTDAEGQVDGRSPGGPGPLSPSSKRGRGPIRRKLWVLEVSALVVGLCGVAWLSWARTLGDRTTAMVAALSLTTAVCAVVVSRLADRRASDHRGGAVLAIAAFGATPAIAFATLRALSEPLMGVAFTTPQAERFESTQAVVIAVGLAAVCAVAAAVIAQRRLEEGRLSHAVVKALTWSPLVIVPLVLGLVWLAGPRMIPPEHYSVSQPVLAHLDPEATGGVFVVDELAHEEGITLVRVCNGGPVCQTVLRRGDRITSRPGLVPRSSPVHLRYDPVHRLYLVETAGELVSTVNASNLASYHALLPHHVRGSISPPRVFSALALLALALWIPIGWWRRRLRGAIARMKKAQSGVCFGDGWALLTDGTTFRVPQEIAAGGILVSWERSALRLHEGDRGQLVRQLGHRLQLLDGVQLTTAWVLCTPLLMAVAVV